LSYVVFLFILIILSNFFILIENGIHDRNVTGVQTCALPILQPFFDTIRDVIEEVDEAFRWVLSIGDIPYSPFILMIIITIIGFFLSGWKMGLFSLVGLWLINNLVYWD